MKLLFLTQYYPPETGAPQNRLSELAVRLKQMGHDVSVLTAMPNYPAMKIKEGYRGKLFMKEIVNGIPVRRTWIYVSSSKSILSRLLNYFSFVCTSLIAGLLHRQRYDFLFCESPPLFLGITAWLLKTFKGMKLVFNVSDLWPESAAKLGLVTNPALLYAARRLEEFLYRSSALITGQTEGIVNDISRRFPHKPIQLLRNGIDLEIYDEVSGGDWRREAGLNENDFVVLYAGIIGYAQGLDVILDAADRLREHGRIRFVLVGNGPEKQRLVEHKRLRNLGNVLFYDALPKDRLLKVVGECDASVIPLRKLDIFLGAIPSKIFDSLAMKKPILLAVNGEARRLFIDEGRCGLYVEPEDAQDLAEKTLALFRNSELCRKLGEAGHAYAKSKFLWKDITGGLANALQHLEVN